tara:strand:+ start:155 stop:634 length:480 start_codon:yes stop_codon:yes gene_type:complete
MISAITSMAAGIELVTELLSAAVILMALDKLATAIRWTYAAGRYTGRLWFTYGLPAFLMVADGISWLNSQIDWRFVAATVWDCLKVVTALAITAYSLTCDAHKRWIGSINWDLPAAPAINPLFEIAAELEQLTGKQLKAITGSRRRAAKRELVAAYMAR